MGLSLLALIIFLLLRTKINDNKDKPMLIAIDKRGSINLPAALRKELGLGKRGRFTKVSYTEH